MQTDSPKLGEYDLFPPRPVSTSDSIDHKTTTTGERALIYWRLIQYLLLAASVVLVVLLLYMPDIGLDILWNMLIPIAPALVVVAPGLWRNICPMATLSLLPQYLGLSRQGSLTRHQAALLSVAGIAALFAIVPYRHLNLDTNGPGSALMLLSAGVVAIVMGTRFKWRSGWCTTLCPIHPVERLYGMAPAMTFSNTRCIQCDHCTTPCPDSTRSMTPAITGHVMIGSFVGFVWGWYQLPDYSGDIDASHYLFAYLWPLGGALVSLTVYTIFFRWIIVTNEARNLLIRVFATAAVSTYYWFRIPALIGFGPYHGTGMLYDLTPVLPGWSEHLSHTLTTAFFIWFILLRRNPDAGWMMRPAPKPQ